MKKLLKKAFTLVELLVVIAILATLAMVGIVSYNSFKNKADKSNDDTIVAELNRFVTAAVTNGSKFNTVNDVSELLFKEGFYLSNLNPRQSNSVYGFDLETKKFSIINAESEAKTSIFAFVDTDQEFTSYKEKFSVYLQKNIGRTELVITNGLDLGDVTNIERISYSNENGPSKSVMIRTNELYAKQTEVNIVGYVNPSDPTDCDTVHIEHGIANNVKGGQCSTHIHGNISYLEVSNGNIVFENDANVGTLFLNATGVRNDDNPFDNITLTICDGAHIGVLDYTGKEQPSGSQEPVEEKKMIDRSQFSIGDGALICKVQNADQNGSIDQDGVDYIWFFGNGVFDETIHTGDIVISKSAEKDNARDQGVTLDEVKDSGSDVSIIAIKIAEGYIKNDNGDYTTASGDVIVTKEQAETDPTAAKVMINQKIAEETTLVKNDNGDYVDKNDNVIVTAQVASQDPSAVQKAQEQLAKEKFTTNVGLTEEKKETRKEEVVTEAEKKIEENCIHTIVEGVCTKCGYVETPKSKSDEELVAENGVIRIVNKDKLYAPKAGASQQEIADVINECIMDAEDGDIVKLLKDVTITSESAGYYIEAAAIYVPANKNIVIDLNNKTIHVLEPEYAADGDEYNNDHRWDAAVYALDIAKETTVSIKNGTITGDGKFAIWNKGTINELDSVKCYTNSETFEGTSDSDNITALKNSGSIKSIKNCEFVGYRSPYAHGIINFGNINLIKDSKIAVDLNNEEMINYNHAIYNSQSATIGTIDNCEIFMRTNKSEGDKYYNQPYTIENLGLIHELKDCKISSYLDCIRNNGTIEVFASGYFDGALSGGGAFNVTGGYFTKPLSQNVLAENYVPAESDNPNNPYTCKYDVEAYSKLSFEAQLNGLQKFATLNGAIAAAKKGDTIKLLSDINSQVVITKAITLDMNGYSIIPDLTSFSYTMQIALAKDDKGTVTIMDSSNSGNSVIGGGVNNGYTIQSYQPYTTIDLLGVTVKGTSGWTITAQQSTINIKEGTRVIGGNYECISCTYNGWIVLDGGTIETTKNTAVKLEAPNGYNMQPLLKMISGEIIVNAEGSSVAAIELKSTSDAKAKCQILGGTITVNGNKKSSLYAIKDNGNYSDYASDISIKDCSITLDNCSSSGTVISCYGITIENSTITLSNCGSSSYAIKCKNYTENQYNTNNNKVIKITNCTITGPTSFASLYTQEITND